MNLSVRLFLLLFPAIVLVVYLLYETAVEQIDLSINQATEETLVDMANLLAEILEDDFKQKKLTGQNLQKAFSDYTQRKIDADIYNIVKTSGSLRVYISDHQGIVLFDSENQDVGRDFSRWNDVYLTLKGEYGARATRLDSNKENTSILYVAAPIYSKREIIGVLTVAKSKASLRPYREFVLQSVLDYSFMLAAFLLVFVIFVSLRLRGSTNKLVSYARKAATSKKERVKAPEFIEPEFNQVSKAMEDMRQQLEGKAYIEKYVQSLTHEIKSPVSAIAGALEFLLEDISDEDSRRLLENIGNENRRLEEIASKMLELAALEHRQALTRKVKLCLKLIVEAQIESRQGLIERYRLKLKLELDTSETTGDEFLLAQAISNLIDNAIRFSPEDGDLVVSLKKGVFSIKDQGPGVPAFALQRIFDRFFSLPDPKTQRKSTGLGLSFVRQIVDLHGATISVENTSPGLRVSISFEFTGAQ